MADQKTQEEKRKEFDAIEATRGIIIIKFVDENNSIAHADLENVPTNEVLDALKQIASMLI